MRLPVTSFRARIIALVLTVAVIPLFVLGLWITRATARAGEEMLRLRLEQALDETVTQVARSWAVQRSSLLDLADVAPRILVADQRSARPVHRNSSQARSPVVTPDAFVSPAGVVSRNEGLRSLELRDADGVLRWTSATMPRDDTPVVPMEVDVFDGPLGARIGTLRASVSATALFSAPGPQHARAVAGVVLAAMEPESGASLLPLALDPMLLMQERFSLGDELWLVSRRTLTDPALLIAAAAPLSPFTRSLERIARTGALLLLLVAAAGTVAAVLLTDYLTRSLRALARAADAVAAGDLEQSLVLSGEDEVGRVTAAFNSMTASLRTTMSELADKRALAAVGEFAASLAHEIRNPLTAVQLDMQMVEERLPADDQIARSTQRRALGDIRRLDETLAGALRTARSGRLSAESVALFDVVHAAARAAAPVIAEAGASLSLPAATDKSPHLRGDRAALEQVMLNLLLNAARAVSAGQTIYVAIEPRSNEVLLTVRDEGIGIAAADLPRVFDPLFTTRADGAGLGLAIARRLVEAHGGSISLDSNLGAGTTVSVVLPL